MSVSGGMRKVPSGGTLCSQYEAESAAQHVGSGRDGTKDLAIRITLLQGIHKRK